MNGKQAEKLPQEQYREEVELCNEFLAKSPENIPLLFKKARALKNIGDTRRDILLPAYDHVIMECRAALEDKNIEAISKIKDFLKYALVEKGEILSPINRKSAIVAFKESLEIDKNFVPALLNLGATYHQGKTLETASEALGFFKQVLEIEPKNQLALLSAKEIVGQIGSGVFDSFEKKYTNQKTCFTNSNIR